jgi:hypothetical protein
VCGPVLHVKGLCQLVKHGRKDAKCLRLRKQLVVLLNLRRFVEWHLSAEPVEPDLLPPEERGYKDEATQEG